MKEAFSLKAKIARLEEIERSFDGAELDLDIAIKLHAEAIAVAKEIQEYLVTAENELSKLDTASLRKA